MSSIQTVTVSRGPVTLTLVMRDVEPLTPESRFWAEEMLDTVLDASPTIQGLVKATPDVEH